MTLDGANALITGGGSGLGLACAKRLADDGATVTIVGRTEERLQKALAELGERARYAVCDVTEESSVERAVAVADEGDGLRIVVVSAGVGWTAPIATIPVEAWRNVMEINLTGTFLTLKHSAPVMRRHGGGSFIAISSVAGAITVRWMTPYTTAKAGLDMLVRTAADELGTHGIRVNSVLPGLVPTELASGIADDDTLREEFLSNQPVRRLGTPEDVADAVRFLAGPESSWITGVCLPVDGGAHLRRGPSWDSYIAEEHGTEWLPS